MWWECSDCGCHVDGSRAPLVCAECGIAGVIFVPANIDDPITGDPAADSLRAAWLQAGMERARDRAA
jgi:hypothetical protein